LALHELIHFELIDHAGLLALASCGDQKASVGIQETGETSYERRTDLVGSESRRTHNANGLNAPAVRIRCAACGVLEDRHI
jgi:hypothetical protein